MKEPSSALKKREDRASFVRFIFEPVVTEIKSANTMILLLQSEEEHIVVQVQHSQKCRYKYFCMFISRQY